MTNPITKVYRLPALGIDVQPSAMVFEVYVWFLRGLGAALAFALVG